MDWIRWFRPAREEAENVSARKIISFRNNLKTANGDKCHVFYASKAPRVATVVPSIEISGAGAADRRRIVTLRLETDEQSDGT